MALQKQLRLFMVHAVQSHGLPTSKAIWQAKGRRAPQALASQLGLKGGQSEPKADGLKGGQSEPQADGLKGGQSEPQADGLLPIPYVYEKVQADLPQPKSLMSSSCSSYTLNCFLCAYLHLAG